MDHRFVTSGRSRATCTTHHPVRHGLTASIHRYRVTRGVTSRVAVTESFEMRPHKAPSLFVPGDPTQPRRPRSSLCGIHLGDNRPSATQPPSGRHRLSHEVRSDPVRSLTRHVSTTRKSERTDGRSIRRMVRCRPRVFRGRPTKRPTDGRTRDKID